MTPRDLSRRDFVGSTSKIAMGAMIVPSHVLGNVVGRQAPLCRDQDPGGREKNQGEQAQATAHSSLHRFAKRLQTSSYVRRFGLAGRALVFAPKVNQLVNFRADFAL